MASRSSEKIDAGKRGVHHRLEQGEINRLLVAHARRGKRVVRLKGGDPFLFGRGGEEAEFLARHGIPFEIVPGVSSATAVPAYAGIPVTDRRHNSMFTVVTGHSAEGPGGDPAVDWKRISPSGTLVILMGVSRLEDILKRLQTLGWAKNLPAACVQWGTTSEQRTLIGTVGNLAERVRKARPRFGAPAVIVVGEVVRLSGTIGWFSPRRKKRGGR
jgi:uroporphyrin-III C-methyltransferase